MPAGPRIEELAKQARFVFKGTVKQLKAATMPEVPVTESTVIVRVDEIIQAPAMLSHYTGQDITVQLSTRKKVKVGQEAIFFTNGWLFGESVAVQAINHHPVKRATAALRRPAGDPVKSLADRDMRVHFDNADLVVSGRVASVRGPQGIPGVSTRLPPSEHDPLWQEAVVEVNAVHKGSHSQHTVIVRFPSSHDIMWHDAPKLRPGQEGYFILHKAQGEDWGPKRTAEGSAETVAVSGTQGEALYTVLHPEDFQSIHQSEGIKR